MRGRVRVQGAAAFVRLAEGDTEAIHPPLVDRRRTGAPLNPIRDAYLMYTGEEEGYIDYPTLAPDRDRVLASGSH
ncbi:hypothetical protein ACWGR4_28300 [Embleya sp. NPDC055664]